LLLFLLKLQKIDRDSAIVPRGALSVDTGKRVILNNNYAGLSYQTSLELRAYLHFRPPESLQGIALLKRPGIVKTDDFLDSIDKDLPKGFCELFLTFYTIVVMIIFSKPCCEANIFHSKYNNKNIIRMTTMIR
jgi:hypothetical protein